MRRKENKFRKRIFKGVRLLWLIKAEEETDERFGKYPEERSIPELIQSSLVIIDKHAGPTSHQVTGWTKEIFEAKKAGHAGTLE